MSKIKKIIEKISKCPSCKDVTLDEIIIFLKHFGYEHISTKGSHFKFYNKDTKGVLVIPIHGKHIKPAYIDMAKKVIED